MSEWLIDKSALVRLSYSDDVDQWVTRIERGMVRISNMTRLEIGYSAHSGEVGRREFRESPLAAMPVEYLTPRIEDRALEVQLLLADRGSTVGRQFRTSSSPPPRSSAGWRSCTSTRISRRSVRSPGNLRSGWHCLVERRPLSSLEDAACRC